VPQLSDEQIKEITAECLEKRPGPEITLWYKHVPDGAYDDLETRCRKFIARGFCYLVATSDWVNDPVANLRLPEWMREPWLTYPDLPPKPPKK
jgi:hypothetical protein